MRVLLARLPAAGCGSTVEIMPVSKGPVAVRPMVGVQVVNSQVEAAVVSCMALSFHPAKAYKVPAFVGKGLFLSASCPYK